MVSVVPHVLELHCTQNHDVAFGALSQWDLPHKALILVVVSIANSLRLRR